MADIIADDADDVKAKREVGEAVPAPVGAGHITHRFELLTIDGIAWTAVLATESPLDFNKHYFILMRIMED